MLRGKPGGEIRGPVIVCKQVQPNLLEPLLLLFLGAALPFVAPDGLFELRGSRRQRKLHKLILASRVGNPRQRSHLGVAQPPLRECRRDPRKVLQRPPDPHVLARRGQTQSTLPRQPLRGRPQSPLPPRLSPIELGDQHDEAARRRRDLPRERADLRLQALGRCLDDVAANIENNSHARTPPSDTSRDRPYREAETSTPRPRQPTPNERVAMSLTRRAQSEGSTAPVVALHGPDRPSLLAVHPVIEVGDTALAVGWYREAMGFEVAFDDGGDPPGYVGLRRDGVEVTRLGERGNSASTIPTATRWCSTATADTAPAVSCEGGCHPR